MAVGTGVVIGLVVAYMLAPRVEALLFGVSGHSARVFALVSAILLTVALAAALIPAVRALRIAPHVALTAE